MKLPKKLPKAIYMTDGDGEISFFAINPEWIEEKGEQPFMTSTGFVDGYSYSYWTDEEFTYLTKNSDGEIEIDEDDNSYPYHPDHKKIENSLTINIDSISDKSWDKLIEQIEAEYEIASV